jgi:hypothetical protein
METNETESGAWTGWFIAFMLLVLLLLAPVARILQFGISDCGRRQENSCIANLKIIEGAKATWALESEKLPEDIPLPEDLYGVTKYFPAAPDCPDGGIYTLGRVDQKPMCSLRDKGHLL